jgi:hypothetical protein
MQPARSIEPLESRPTTYGTDGEFWLSCHKEISTEHTLATSVRTRAQLFQAAPVWLCHICSLYLTNEMIFEKKKVIEHEMYRDFHHNFCLKHFLF